jgi:hypothetical protein
MNKKVKLRFSDWNNNVWGNYDFFFETPEQAKKKAKNLKKPGKIYNHLGWLIGKHNPHRDEDDDNDDGYE